MKKICVKCHNKYDKKHLKMLVRMLSQDGNCVRMSKFNFGKTVKLMSDERHEKLIDIMIKTFDIGTRVF